MSAEAIQKTGRGLPAQTLPERVDTTSSRVPLLLTIDVEDYYHAETFRAAIHPRDWKWYPSRTENSVNRLLELLGRFDAKATWFILGWEAEQRPALVRRIVEHGHEVACGSHLGRRLQEHTPASFREDVERAKQAIEDACGKAVIGFRAPALTLDSSTMWVFEILAEMGFRYDSSMPALPDNDRPFPGLDHGAHRVFCPDGPLWEFPVAAPRAWLRRRVVSDLRHHRPGTLLKMSRRVWNEGSAPAVVRLPVWELDAEQPRLWAGLSDRLRHYGSLGRAEGRLSRLLQDVHVRTGAELCASLDATAATEPILVESRPVPGKPDMPATALAHPDVLTGIEQLWLQGYRQWGHGWLRLWGMSMYPALRPGDRVLVKKVPEQGLQPGDIGVFFNGHRIIVHRVFATVGSVGRRRYFESGDATDRWSLMPESGVIGRVAAVDRGGVIEQWDAVARGGKARSFVELLATLSGFKKRFAKAESVESTESSL